MIFLITKLSDEQHIKNLSEMDRHKVMNYDVIERCQI